MNSPPSSSLLAKATAWMRMSRLPVGLPPAREDALDVLVALDVAGLHEGRAELLCERADALLDEHLDRREADRRLPRDGAPGRCPRRWSGRWPGRRPGRACPPADPCAAYLPATDRGPRRVGPRSVLRRRRPAGKDAPCAGRAGGRCADRCAGLPEPPPGPPPGRTGGTGGGPQTAACGDDRGVMQAAMLGSRAAGPSTASGGVL